VWCSNELGVSQCKFHVATVSSVIYSSKRCTQGALICNKKSQSNKSVCDWQLTYLLTFLLTIWRRTFCFSPFLTPRLICAQFPVTCESVSQSASQIHIAFAAVAIALHCERSCASENVSVMPCRKMWSSQAVLLVGRPLGSLQKESGEISVSGRTAGSKAVRCWNITAESGDVCV